MHLAFEYVTLINFSRILHQTITAPMVALKIQIVLKTCKTCVLSAKKLRALEQPARITIKAVAAVMMGCVVAVVYIVPSLFCVGLYH